jgi:hypothetical protein
MSSTSARQRRSAGEPAKFIVSRGMERIGGSIGRSGGAARTRRNVPQCRGAAAGRSLRPRPSTPQLAVDDDRHPHRRAPVHLACGRSGDTGCVCVTVDPAGLPHFEAPPRRDPPRCSTPRDDQPRRRRPTSPSCDPNPGSSARPGLPTSRSPAALHAGHDSSSRVRQALQD